MNNLNLKYILRDGKPEVVEDFMEWGAWMQVQENKRVAWDELPNDVKVSTVFLGIDHCFSQNGPPILFETMVFGGPLDQEMERYATIEEARLGHEAMVERE